MPADPSFPDALTGRCHFSGHELPTPLPASPFSLLADWLADAAARKTQPNPNAVTLATADAEGRPSARIVLARGLDTGRGFVVVYTNYDSRKGLDLAANPRAALVFHWDHLERQVRLEGLVTRSPAAESDAYFNTRPLGSRLGAWASQQSRPLAQRDDLMTAAFDAMQRFGVSVDADLEHDRTITIPRPPHWGGYRLWATRVELWLGHPNRLHDRTAWTRDLTPATVDGVPGFEGSAWSSQRLQP